MQLDLEPVGIAVGLHGQGFGGFGLDAQLFADLAHQRLFGPLAVFDLAAREFPETSEWTSGRTPRHQRRAQAEPRTAEGVEIRCFGGYTEPEIDDIQGITERTVQRDWRRARAFLMAQLGNA